MKFVKVRSCTLDLSYIQLLTQDCTEAFVHVHMPVTQLHIHEMNNDWSLD